MIHKIVETLLPTKYGDFNIIAFDKNEKNDFPHLALVHKNIDLSNPVLIRMHSECITGDLFGSKKCDCGEQLEKALEELGKANGILLYLRQEGRGIGLINKLRAYKLQESGLNTIEANLHLGFKAEERNFSEAIKILQQLSVKEVKVLTNNPIKLEAFEDSGIKVVERIPLVIDSNETNEEYLKIKKNEMRHMM